MEEGCLPNTTDVLLKTANPEIHLLECMETIVKDFPPRESWDEDETCGGLYFGPTALSYLFLYLSKTHPDLIIESKRPMELAKAYISGTRPAPVVNPLDCGVINEEVSFCAVAAAVHQDVSYVHRFLALIPSHDLLSPTGSNEWIYGRSGLLYLLRLIRTWLPSAAALVAPATTQLVNTILAQGPAWTWQNQQFLGAGHGHMGIITQLILTDPSRAPDLGPHILTLLAQQTDSGTWPYSLEKPKLLAQFCHGAPGFVIGLLSIRPHLPPHLHAPVDAAVARARECTWKYGILRKEPNLCHGVTGNALALPKGGQRDHFLAYGTKEMVERGRAEGWWVSGDYGLQFSLGFGSVPGRAWGWMLAEKEEGVYITFNDV